MKTYIEYYFPGSFVSETSSREIESRDKLPDFPSRAFGFRTYERESAVVNGEVLLGKPKNYSPTIYFGTELTGEEAIFGQPNNSILRMNIEGNGYKRLVKTKFGQLLPLSEGDIVLETRDGK